jgi:anti-sigma B factor antagonist
VLGLRGELGALTAPDVQQILDGQLAAAPKAIILDLAELGFLGSAGISVLTCAAFRAWLNDTGFCVAGARRAVARTLRASGLVELFDLHDTVEDAVVTYG